MRLGGAATCGPGAGLFLYPRRGFPIHARRAATMEAATSELSQWRELGERVGLSALIVLCIVYLLLKSGRFLGPVLVGFIGELRETNKQMPMIAQQNADTNAKIAQLLEQSSVPKDLARPGIELVGKMAHKMGVAPEEANPLLEEMRGAVRK